MLRTKPVRREKICGLQFPVARVERLIRGVSPGLRISADALCFLTAIMEYIAAEVLELAGNATRDRKRVTIDSRALTLAMQSDDELYKLAKCLGWAPGRGGTVPNMHSALLDQVQYNVKHGKRGMVERNKGHRFRPGVPALRQVKKMQQYDGFLIRRLPFERVVRKLAEAEATNLRFGDGSIDLIQAYIERRMVSVLRQAQKFAIHAGRQGVAVKDIQLAEKQCGKDSMLECPNVAESPEQIDLKTFIYKVLRQVHPDTGITGEAMAQVNQLILLIGTKIIQEANYLSSARVMGAQHRRAPTDKEKALRAQRGVKKVENKTKRVYAEGGMSTLKSRAIASAVKLRFPGELAKHALVEGRKAVTKWVTSGVGEKKKKSPRMKLASPRRFGSSPLPSPRRSPMSSPRASSASSLYVSDPGSPRSLGSSSPRRAGTFA